MVAGLLALPALAVRAVADPSPWLHLKVGAFLAAGHRFGSPDPWAPFASTPYVPTQWLPSVVTWWAYDRFGLAVVVWERAAGIGVLSLVLLLWAMRIARPALAAGATVVAVYAAWPGLTERPQLIGFLLLVPVLVAWWRTGHDLRPRWWLVPLTWVAACTHGVFAIGIALGVVVVAGLVLERRTTLAQARRLLALLAACVVAAGLTPLGPSLLLTPFTVSEQGRQFVAEWLPSSVRSPHVLAVLALLAVSWWCWARADARPPLWMALLSGCAFVLAMSMQRTVPVAAFVALPLALFAVESTSAERTGWVGPDGATPGFGAHRPPRRLVVALVVATALGAALAVPVSVAHADTVEGVPTDLQTALRPLPAGTRIIAPADLTGWLFCAAPQLRPVEDIRVETYSPAHVRDYIGAMAAEPGWDRFVSRTGATTALLADDSPLAAALTEGAGWRTIAAGDGHLLLEAPR